MLGCSPKAHSFVLKAYLDDCDAGFPMRVSTLIHLQIHRLYLTPISVGSLLNTSSNNPGPFLRSPPTHSFVHTSAQDIATCDDRRPGAHWSARGMSRSAALGRHNYPRPLSRCEHARNRGGVSRGNDPVWRTRRLVSRTPELCDADSAAPCLRPGGGDGKMAGGEAEGVGCQGWEVERGREGLARFSVSFTL